jgi:hypothetical protein
MSVKSYLNPQNLAIQLADIFTQELELLAELGTNWSLYRVGGGLFCAIRTLTHAQIVPLRTTAVEIAPAPGPRKIIVPVNVFISTSIATDYTGIDADARIDFLVGTNTPISSAYNDADGSVSGLLAPTANYGETAAFGIGGIQSIADAAHSSSSGMYANGLASAMMNAPFRVKAANDADFTAGAAANTMTVRVNFTVISV